MIISYDDDTELIFEVKNWVLVKEKVQQGLIIVINGLI